MALIAGDRYGPSSSLLTSALSLHLVPSQSPRIVETCASNTCSPSRHKPTPHDLTLLVDRDRAFDALHLRLQKPLTPPAYSPIIVRDVSSKVWELFREKYAEHPALRSLRFEYSTSRGKITAMPLAAPLHDFANKVMTRHVYMGMSAAYLDSPRRISSLMIDRECFQKSTGDGGCDQREPDSALWTPAYKLGIIPTIVWEVGHSQKRSSLHRRAKMWCRRYDGKVHVVILFKYLRKDPRRNNACILEIYRPAWLPRTPGGPSRWTARKDGQTYTVLPRPAHARPEVYNNPADAIPLTYRDYFGEGNVTNRIDPSTRFDLPLELIREMIEIVVPVTARREQYRFVPGGSSVGGADNAMEVQEEPSAPEPAYGELREGTPVGTPVISEDEMEYENNGSDWDAAISDVSDSDG